jgi:hypothetical protein
LQKFKKPLLRQLSVSFFTFSALDACINNDREACDTKQTGSLVDGEYANEEIESSCHPLICDPKEIRQSSFYRNHPTDRKMDCL